MPSRTKLFVLLILCLSSIGSGYAQEYLVGNGDVLKITVYDNDDLKTVVRVSGEGTIGVPLLGKIKVKNLTIPQISEKLARLFADGYLKNPQVNVFIDDYRAQKVVILGQVNRPGLYELRGPTTFLELISKAGGLTKDIGDKAIIKRKPIKSQNRDQTVITLNLINLIEKGDVSQNILIIDGDNIYLNKAGYFYVTGEVKKPNAYKYREETTVIKAIAMAGGFTGKASKNKVKIYREVNDKKEIIEKVKPDEPVLENDVIVVPESFF